MIPNKLIGVEKICGDRHNLGKPPRRRQLIFEVDGVCSEDSAGTIVGAISNENPYLPTRHRHVEHPAPGKSDGVDHVVSDNVESVAQNPVPVGRAAGSALSRQVWTNGFEVSNGHTVSTCAGVFG
jgi:hypothetical protein